MTPLQLPSDDSSEGVGEPSEQVRRADQVRAPASNKKGGRECRQQKGRDERVEIAGVTSNTTLSKPLAVPWAPFTNCQKKRGPTPSQFDALPLHRRSTRRITRGPPTGRRHYDQTTTGVSNPRKSRGPTLCLCSTHSSLYGQCSFVFAPLQTKPLSVEALIKKEGKRHPLKVVETCFVVHRSLTSSLF